MRATCLGARSGRISITTRPYFKSRYSVSSGPAACAPTAPASKAANAAPMMRVIMRVMPLLFCQPHAHDLVRILHPAAAVLRTSLLDPVDEFHAARHLAPHGVLV